MSNARAPGATAAFALDGRGARHYTLRTMFTGLVATTGELAAREARGPGARLVLRARFDDGPLVHGESITVDGACLSVAEILPDGFAVDVSAETVARTTLGTLELGRRVNLERSLRAGDRLGGHLVSGHVDGVGTLAARRPVGEALELRFALPGRDAGGDGGPGRDLAPFVAEKGSIAINGVSMTVNACSPAGAGTFDVAVIPITQRETNLGGLAVGDPVNLEVDLVARYVERLLATRHG